MQQIDITKYKALYLQTAQQYLQTFSSNLAAYSQNQTISEAINQMFISIHSIKSQSLVMGYTEFGNYCKDVEQKLRTLKDGLTPFPPDTLSYLQSVQEKIKEELSSIQNTGKDMSSGSSVSSPLSSVIPVVSQKHLLLVEDDSFFEQFYSYKLKESGYSVNVAKNGEDGLQQMKTHRPDVILLDLIMPIKDGFAVLREKQQDPSISSIPVIVFSTLGQEADIEKAKGLGANEYVNKSFFEFESLLAKIQSVQEKTAHDYH